jgi:cell division protein FtsN
MSEQHNIQLAFTRSRFALLIGTAVVTGIGLLAAGLFAGMEVGSAQARAVTPQAPPETPSTLPLQFTHELPVIGQVASPAASADEPDTNLVTGQQQYVVQAASFRERSEAAKLTGDLTQHGYSAGILEFKDEAGRSWFAVRVGPYGARAEASQSASELGPLTRSEPIVRVVEN